MPPGGRRRLDCHRRTCLLAHLTSYGRTGARQWQGLPVCGLLWVAGDHLMTLGFKGIHGSRQRMLLNQNDVRVICRQGENGNTGLRQTGCEFSEYSDFSKNRVCHRSQMLAIPTDGTDREEHSPCHTRRSIHRHGDTRTKNPCCKPISESLHDLPEYWYPSGTRKAHLGASEAEIGACSKRHLKAHLSLLTLLVADTDIPATAQIRGKTLCEGRRTARLRPW